MHGRRLGRTRIKLAEMLSVALETYVDPADLWEQSGDYRTNKMHEALVWGVNHLGVGSWDTMTDCVRHGFDVTRRVSFRQPMSSGMAIQIDAKK